MRGRKVNKIYSEAGVPGLVSKTKCQKTKTWVAVYNVLQSNFNTSDPDWPWVTVCLLHDEHIGASTLPKAKSAVSNPDKFCNKCRNELNRD